MVRDPNAVGVDADAGAFCDGSRGDEATDVEVVGVVEGSGGASSARVRVALVQVALGGQPELAQDQGVAAGPGLPDRRARLLLGLPVAAAVDLGRGLAAGGLAVVPGRRPVSGGRRRPVSGRRRSGRAVRRALLPPRRRVLVPLAGGVLGAGTGRLLIDVGHVRGSGV
jgi:hypothetical protein